MSLRFAGIESEETEHDRDGPQWTKENESPTKAVLDLQDFEPNIDDYEADTVEDAEEDSDDDNCSNSEQAMDTDIYGPIDAHNRFQKSATQPSTTITPQLCTYAWGISMTKETRHTISAI